VPHYKSSHSGAIRSSYKSRQPKAAYRTYDTYRRASLGSRLRRLPQTIILAKYYLPAWE